MTGIPVLMYHHISPTPGALTVHPSVFREQLSWLQRSGYRFLSAEEYQSVHTTEAEMDGRSVLLTFDDGWLDNWQHAIPILQEFGAPAIFFIVSDWPGKGDPRENLFESDARAVSHDEAMAITRGRSHLDSVIMRWSELLYAQREASISIQSHSHSHGDWWNESTIATRMDALLRQDLLHSVKTIGRNIGTTPIQLSWPKGQFSRNMLKIAYDLGFVVQHSTLRGTNTGSGRTTAYHRTN